MENSAILRLPLFIGVVLRLFGFIVVGAFLSRLFFSLLTGADLMDSESILFDMEGGASVRYRLLLMQALHALFAYMALPLIYLFVFNKELKRQVFQVKRMFKVFIGLSVLIYLTALPFISQLIVWNQSLQLPDRLSDLQQVLLAMEEKSQKVTQMIVYYESWYEVIPIVLVVAVLAGVGEEFLFRGIIQNELSGILQGTHIAIWSSAILFSFIHFQFQGFLPRLVLGALFGYLYHWSGSLLVPILIHILNNALTFALVNLARDQSEMVQGATVSLPVTIVTSIVCVFLLVVVYRYSINGKGLDSTRCTFSER